jgi:hypothetical protein
VTGNFCKPGAGLVRVKNTRFQFNLFMLLGFLGDVLLSRRKRR